VVCALCSIIRSFLLISVCEHHAHSQSCDGHTAATLVQRCTVMFVRDETHLVRAMTRLRHGDSPAAQRHSAATPLLVGQK
jgi:hypothetical protein